VNPKLQAHLSQRFFAAEANCFAQKLALLKTVKRAKQTICFWE
jgi:hypothetical protein